ncbi:hypothetical protein HYT55_00005 [Candidatus Woesearchaeota archaeon]|nr:hypothetical protein [Candidatus Woesearchaeota archaeon]
MPPLSQEELGLPYYLFESRSYFPSLKEVENQLELYVDHELGFCLQNFDHFVKQGYVLLSEDISTTVSLSFNTVRFDLAFPLKIQKDSSTKSLDSFSTSVPSRLYVLYNTTSAYMDDQAQFPQSICLSCLHSLMGEQNVYAELRLVNDSEEKIVFVITDQQSNLIYQFLNEYDFQKAGTDLADYENLSEFVKEDFEEEASNESQ